MHTVRSLDADLPDGSAAARGHATPSQVAYGARLGSVFSGSRDCTVRQWARGKADAIQTFTGHSLVVTALALSPGPLLRLELLSGTGRVLSYLSGQRA